MLAEIGIVLLLFTIGLEFLLRRILEMKRLVLFGGRLQVTLTTLLVTGLAVAKEPNIRAPTTRASSRQTSPRRAIILF